MNTMDLDRLGDEIAELSVHLEAATARLLDLIREFDAHGGWGNGFRSCADWLSASALRARWGRCPCLPELSLAVSCRTPKYVR